MIMVVINLSCIDLPFFPLEFVARYRDPHFKWEQITTVELIIWFKTNVN